MLSDEERAWKFDRRSDPFREGVLSDVERAMRNAMVTQEVADAMNTQRERLKVIRLFPRITSEMIRECE